MNYESFRAAWEDTLRVSRLPVLVPAEETMNTGLLDREYVVYVQPLGGQDAEPFHVTAKLSWAWASLNTARSRSTEEDVLSELLGRKGAQNLKTEKPWVRVDVVLGASAPYGKALPMPKPAAWAAWVREVMERLENIEPLLPEESVRENEMGMLEVLAWKGEPEVVCHCGPGGELRLNEVKLAAGVLISLPRKLDCPDEEDDPPDEQLQEFFGRVRASLHAWMQALDHLRVKR